MLQKWHGTILVNLTRDIFSEANLLSVGPGGHGSRLNRICY